ncbi:glutathione S-transferase [Chaetomium strumarium]|uniref:Glutathione S-transferase n=1 Tax=Chaetomium strumarium TaxID=1170767 RepID=A0AAJ0GKX4_9PEZI|nr:glutathione S-transferase [Chaetomium strumarium]
MTADQPATSQPPKITLYWLNDSRAQRMVWLLEELGLDYDIEMFERTSEMFAPSELQKIHPLGKSPVVRLTTPDPIDPTRQRDLVLAESGFIAEYLCEHFGGHGPGQSGLLPARYRPGQEEGRLGAETEEWMRCQFFLHYAEGSLMPPLLVALILNILKSPRIPFILRPMTSGIANKIMAAFVVRQMAIHLSFLESQLETSPGKGNYLCGTRLTAADILMSYPLIEARERVGSFSTTSSVGAKGQGGKKLADSYPKVWAYLDRLVEEPGYKRAESRIEQLQKGGNGRK